MGILVSWTKPTYLDLHGFQEGLNFENVIQKRVYYFRTKVSPWVCSCVRMYLRTAVMFLVNAISPRPLDVATANFAGA